MSKTPVIILPDTKVVVAAVVLAVISLVLWHNVADRIKDYNKQKLYE